MAGIEFENISKEFSGKYVLEDINLSFEENKIHAVVGENGAGKSTLMNILSGVHRAAGGKVKIDGNDVRINSPKDAELLGIGMVHQHFMLIDVLQVWQNIILGNEPKKRISIDKKKAFNNIEDTCKKYGIEIELTKPVGLLTVGEQQRVEILKVLYRNAKYIIFDEPTSVLTPCEITQLLDNIRALKKIAKTIIFISHKLEEVINVADTITVLRDGRNQGTVSCDSTNNIVDVNDIIRKMVGRDIDLGHREKSTFTSQNNIGALQIKNLSTEKKKFNCPCDNLCLDVKRGEIVGVAGVDGNGQLELVNAILHIEGITEGSIFLGGKDITNVKTGELRKESIACIPPDRQEQGLVLDQSIIRNMALGLENRKEFMTRGFLSNTKITKAANDVTGKYNVKYNTLLQPIKDLSGGNQQKLILARECEYKGKELILAVNPTRGLDIGAIEFVYHCLNQYKKDGKAILLISTELQEILTLSDRIAVLYRGAIVKMLENENVNIEEIGAYMAGVKGRAA